MDFQVCQPMSTLSANIPSPFCSPSNQSPPLQSSGKVLLCNACGIRWKRKNRTTDRRRLKPGPKRVRQCSTSSTTALYRAPLPCILQPSLSSMFYKPSMYPMIKTNISSSSTITDPRGDMVLKPRPSDLSQQKSKGGYSRSCSKMDLDRLVCPTNACSVVKPQETAPLRPPHSAHSSPISISNLLNFADEDGINTVCSTTTPYRTLNC